MLGATECGSRLYLRGEQYFVRIINSGAFSFRFVLQRASNRRFNSCVAWERHANIWNAKIITKPCKKIVQAKDKD